MAKGEGRGRLLALEGLRLLAFFGILTEHCATQSRFGAWAVSVFVVLSGFVMRYAYDEREPDTSPRSCVRFSLRKVGRLYPLYVVTLLAQLAANVKAMILEHQPGSVWVYIGKRVVAILALVQSWFPFGDFYFALNGVAWYLSMCLFLYAMFPPLLVRLKRMSVRRSLVTALCVYAAQCVLGLVSTLLQVPPAVSDNLPRWLTYICPAFRLGDFVIGGCVANVYLRRREQAKSWALTLCEVAVLAAIFGCQLLYRWNIGPGGSEGFRYTMLYTPTSALLVYLLAVGRGLVSRLLALRPVVWAGGLAANAFLIHNVYIYYLTRGWKRVFHRRLEMPDRIALAFLGSLLFSLLWQQLEKAVRRRRAQRKAAEG